eukprot:888257-Pelagomonas_calceolata.AAC.2
MDASSEAYLPDERHGPIFKLLNKRLFGHTIDSFRQKVTKNNFLLPALDWKFQQDAFKLGLQKVAEGYRNKGGLQSKRLTASLPIKKKGDLQPDCSPDQPVAGPCQPTANPKAQARNRKNPYCGDLQPDCSADRP